MSPSSTAPSRIAWLHVIVLGTVLTLGGALPGLAAAQPRSGGTYEVAYDLSPFTLDAMADTISAKSHIVNNVQEALFAPDAGLVTRPMLVDKWTVSPDGLVWTFSLRKGVLFHNGETLKADDVVASLRRWLSRDGTWAPHLKSRLESLDRVDDSTVKMKLSKPFGAMLEALSMVEGVQPVIFPKSVLDRYPGEKDRVKEQDVIGTGPYKFVSWERDRRIVLERFDRYAARKEPLSGFSGNKTAYFDRVHHNFVPEASGRVAGALTGRYDYAINLPLDQAAQIKANPAMIAKTNPYGGRSEITFNSTIPPFDKKAMRQAVAERAGARGDAGRHRAQGVLHAQLEPVLPEPGHVVQQDRLRDLHHARSQEGPRADHQRRPDAAGEHRGDLDPGGPAGRAPDPGGGPAAGREQALQGGSADHGLDRDGAEALGEEAQRDVQRLQRLVPERPGRADLEQPPASGLGLPRQQDAR